MRVGILLFDEVEELDFVGPLEVFGVTSKLVQSLVILTLSKDGKPITGRYGLKVQPDHSFTDCPTLDLLIVPGGKGARERGREEGEHHGEDEDLGGGAEAPDRGERKVLRNRPR